MKNVLAAGLAIAFALSWGTTLEARTITVASSGGDYTTIAAAVNAAVAGDTVHVSAGTYNERITTRANGSSTSRITIRAAGTVTMNGFEVQHSYTTISGFTITNTAGAGGINVAHNLTGCWLKGNRLGTPDVGHFMSIFGSNHVIENNYFYNTSWDCIRIFGSGHLIRGNEFYQISSDVNNPNHTDIIQTWGDNQEQPIYNTVFENNYMHDCDCQLGNFSVDGMATPGDLVFRNNIYIRVGVQMNIMMPRVKFYNNVYYECNQANGDHVLRLCTASNGNRGDSCVFKNNLFIGCGTGTGMNGWYGGFSGDGTVTGLVADYNYVTSSKATGYLAPGSNFTEPHGIKGGDPKFLNEATYDLRLLASSPAINASTTIAGFSVDINGIPRPQGSAWDMGPYELVTPNAPSNLTAPSRTAHTITLNWTAPTPAIDGNTAASYIIKRDNVQVGTSATTAFTDSNLTESTSYNYQVYAVSVVQAVSATAATGSFSTIGDAVGPIVVRVISASLTKVEVFFDEPVDKTTSESVSSYQLTGGVAVLTAVLQADQKSVVVTTSTQTEGTQYTITISGVKDASVAKNIMTSTQKQFTALFKFEDNFESGNISKWTPSTSSVWSVVDDAGDKSLFINAAVPAERLTVNRTYSVMSFDADIKGYGTSVYRNLSIIIGLQDTSNYYHINFAGTATTSYNGIFKVANKVETRLATGTATLTETAQYHHIRVTWNGATGEIKAYFDQSSTPVFSITDATFTSGKAGVWSKGSKQGYIDNVEVVSYIRTDPFAAGIDNTVAKVISTRLAGIPNPVAGLEALNGLMRSGNFRLCDPAGRPVDMAVMHHAGMFLLQDLARQQVYKIMVLDK